MSTPLDISDWRDPVREHFGITKNGAVENKILTAKSKPGLSDREFWEVWDELSEEDWESLDVGGSLLGFEYSGGGPMSTYDSLSCEDIGDEYLYVKLHFDDGDRWYIAAIPKAGFDELLPVFLVAGFATGCE